MESQFFLGCLPVKFLLSIRKLNFLSSLNQSKIPAIIRVLWQNEDEHLNTCKQYNLVFTERMRWKVEIWKYFKSLIDI